jgi:UDP-glucose 4-epimerase
MEVVRKTVIIFGGTGYVGAHLTVQLFQKGFLVILAESPNLFDHRNYIGLKELCKDHVKLFMLDWRDKKAVSQLFKSVKTDIVVYAGNQYFDEKIDKSFLRSKHLHLDAALNVFSTIEAQLSISVVLISSFKVYGKSNKPILKEDFKLLKGKTDEIELNSLLEKFISLSKEHLNIVIARLSFPIGAHKSLKIGPSLKSCSGRFYKKIFDSIKKGVPFTVNFSESVNGEKFTSRDLIHITDAAEGIALIVNKALLNNVERKQIYNVSSNQIFSSYRLAKAVKFFSKEQFKIEEKKLEISDNLIVRLSNNKLISELGWFQRCQLIEAIKSHVQYLNQYTQNSRKAA